jgi:serine protease AprX
MPTYRRRLPLTLTAFFAACVCTATAFAAEGTLTPGHNARLSADLQDHLDHNSQNIEAIAHGDRATCDALARTYGAVVKKYLTVDGCVLQLTAGQLAALRQDDTQDHISGNLRIKSTDDVTAETIGADQVWAGSTQLPGYDGRGVTVAVIDSGIDTTHYALRGRVLAWKDFTGGDGIDRFGHGTHVAGIIGAQPIATPDGKDYRGIAPGVQLVNLRVLDDAGSGDVASVVEAIDWAVANRERYKIRVINLSLGAPVLQPYRDDPMCEAVERAVRVGIVVVAAAGNNGRNAAGQTVLGSIVSPGNSPYALTVGAVDAHGTPQRSDDTVATYSSRGPTAYDLLIKPDIAAPGSHVASVEAANAYLPRTYPERHVTGSGANAIFQLSGTSMAAAVVSGAASLLLDQRPALRPAQLAAGIELTSTFLTSAGVFGCGAGEINVAASSEIVFGSETRDLPTTEISGESVISSGLRVASIATAAATGIVTGRSIVWTGIRDASIVWTGTTGNSIVWTGASGNSIVWTGTNDSIVWTGDTAESIVWTGTTAGSIVWTNVLTQSIVWTGIANQSIVWTSVDIE